jgi:hypothetical protein
VCACVRENKAMRTLGRKKYEARENSLTTGYLQFVPIIFGSRDSVVGIVTSYGLDDRGIGVRVPVG